MPEGERIGERSNEITFCKKALSELAVVTIFFVKSYAQRPAMFSHGDTRIIFAQKIRQEKSRANFLTDSKQWETLCCLKTGIFHPTYHRLADGIIRRLAVFSLSGN